MLLMETLSCCFCNSSRKIKDFISTGISFISTCKVMCPTDSLISSGQHWLIILLQLLTYLKVFCLSNLHAIEAQIFFYFFNLIFIVFFHLVFSPLMPLPPSNHHTVAHVHESFFFFAQSLHPLTSLPQDIICCPSMSLSQLCLFSLFIRLHISVK